MVEKYDFYHGDCEGDCGRGCRADIVSAADGDYVLASDYAALEAERDKLKRLIEESFTEWQWCPKTEQLFRKVDGHVYHAKVGMHKRWRCFHNGLGGRLFKTIAAFDEYISERRSPATTEGRDNG